MQVCSSNEWAVLTVCDGMMTSFCVFFTLNVLIAYASSYRKAIFIEGMDAGADSIARVCVIQLTLYDYSFLSMQPNGSPKQPSGQSAYIKITRI